MSVTRDVGETGIRRVTGTVGFESEEGPGRGSDCEHPGGASRLGVFRGEWATLTSSPKDFGEASGSGDGT